MSTDFLTDSQVLFVAVVFAVLGTGLALAIAERVKHRG